MAAWVKEEENASKHRQRKREAGDADKEVAPGVTVASSRRFRAALIGPTQGLPKRRRLCCCKLETLKVRSVADAIRLGAWLRSGEGIGRLAAGTIPNSLYRVPFLYLFLTFALCFYSFLLSFLFCFCFSFCFYFVFMFSLEFWRCSSDFFLSRRPRTRLATTYIAGYGRGPIG